MNVHFSKNTPIWETPQSFFDQLNREFRFTLDVCALPQNAENIFRLRKMASSKLGAIRAG